MHRGPRRKVVVRARMRANGPVTDVCIRDISLRGMLLQASVPPPRGTYVEIMSTGLPVVGQVVWLKDRRFGVSTRDTIDVATVINDFAVHDLYETPTARSHVRDAYKLAGPSTAQRLTRSRDAGNAMQFGWIVLFCAGASGLIAWILHEQLSQAFQSVIAAL